MSTEEEDLGSKTETTARRTEHADDSSTSVHVITAKERLEMKKEEEPGPTVAKADVGPETKKDADAKSEPAASPRKDTDAESEPSVSAPKDANTRSKPSASPTSIAQRLERNRIIKNLKDIGSQKPSDLNKKELKVIRFYVSGIGGLER